MSTIKQFVSNSIGKRVYNNIFDGGDENKKHYQCVQLTYFYLKEVFGINRNPEHPLGDGKYNYINLAKYYGFTKITGISKNNKPKRGDVISFGPTWNNDAGHVAIVLASDNDGIYVLEQNAGNGNGNGRGNNKIRISKQPYSNILGIARYNDIQKTINKDSFDKIVYEKGYYIWEATNSLIRQDVVIKTFYLLAGYKHSLNIDGKTYNYNSLKITSNLNDPTTRQELAYIILSFLKNVRKLGLTINNLKTFGIWDGIRPNENLTGEDFTNMIKKAIEKFGNGGAIY